jgi:hypothetical protein
LSFGRQAIGARHDDQQLRESFDALDDLFRMQVGFESGRLDASIASADHRCRARSHPLVAQSKHSAQHVVYNAPTQINSGARLLFSIPNQTPNVDRQRPSIGAVGKDLLSGGDVRDQLREFFIQNGTHIGIQTNVINDCCRLL